MEEQPGPMVAMAALRAEPERPLSAEHCTVTVVERETVVRG